MIKIPTGQLIHSAATKNNLNQFSLISLISKLVLLILSSSVFAVSAVENQPATYSYSGSAEPYAYNVFQEPTPDAVCSKQVAAFNNFIALANPKPVGYPFDYRVLKFSQEVYRCISPSSSPDTDYRFLIYAQDVCPVGETGVAPHVCSTSPITDAQSIVDPTPQPNGPCVTTAQPIAFISGNKVLRELDYTGIEFDNFFFSRTYNSSPIIGNSGISVIDNHGQKMA
jgi:hypothetical protein